MRFAHGVTRGARGLLDIGDERRAMNQTLAAWALFTAAAASVFVAPLLANSWETIGHSYGVVSRLAALLVPQALTTVVPFSLMCGILWGTRKGPAARRLRVPVLLVAAMASLGLFLMWGWVVPASNQAYREIVFEAATRENGAVYGPALKGLNELTLTELRQIMDPPADQRDFVSEDARRYAFTATDGGQIAGQYHRRVAFGWSPLVLAAFALAVIGRRELSRWWLGAAGASAIVAYVFIMLSAGNGFDGALPVAVGAWAPNTAFLLMTAALITKTRHAAL
jgi:lipopolysaccharide export LptBFGC system permease protein LptF